MLCLGNANLKCKCGRQTHPIRTTPLFKALIHVNVPNENTPSTPKLSDFWTGD
jgi:hypothetical protein